MPKGSLKTLNSCYQERHVVDPPLITALFSDDIFFRKKLLDYTCFDYGIDHCEKETIYTKRTKNGYGKKTTTNKYKKIMIRKI